MSADKHPKEKRRSKALTARTADRYELYELSVQDPVTDVKILDRIYRKAHGRHPVSLKEDFCGTAWLCAEWVKSRNERTALGIDLDETPLRWGRKKHLLPLGDAGKRVKLLRKNVLEVTEPKVDITAAFNFSYCIFQTRKELLHYFQRARAGLRSGGFFVLDIHGGPEVIKDMQERRPCGGFVYVWDQGPVDAITHHAIRRIHYRFADGSRLQNAFTYDWRVWTLPEVRDILMDAGYRRVEVYCEGYDDEGQGNAVYRRVEKAQMEDAFVAYVVAWK